MSVRLRAGNSWHSQKDLIDRNVMRGLFAERSDPRGDVRHPGMSNSRKMLTLLHLKRQGGEMCYQSPVPAEAEELGPLCQSCGPRGAPLLPDPWLSREGMGEKSPEISFLLSSSLLLVVAHWPDPLSTKTQESGWCIFERSALWAGA